MARVAKTKTVSMPPKLLSKVQQYQEETGMGFSTLVHVALNSYFDQREALSAMNNLTPLLEKIEQMAKREELKNGKD